MGTRASFWVGDPRNTKEREWLGCVAWSGNEWGDDKKCAEIYTVQEFRDLVKRISEEHRDFSFPERGGWPFPWDTDVFSTDYTYFFDKKAIYVSNFCSEPMSIADFIRYNEEHSSDDSYPEIPDNPSCYNVPATKPYDKSQPDSIMMIGVFRK